MTVSARDIEKLKAIGYEVVDRGNDSGYYYCHYHGGQFWVTGSPEACWEHNKAHAQSPEGMKATMADKVRFIQDVTIWDRSLYGEFVGPRFAAAVIDAIGAIRCQAFGESPEAAVDALFWKVP